MNVFIQILKKRSDVFVLHIEILGMVFYIITLGILLSLKFVNLD